MDVWSFKEKFGQGGHVLEPTSKSWPLAQKVEGRKKKKFKKNGNNPIGVGVDPWPAGDRWLLADPRPLIVGRRPPTVGSTLVPVRLFQFFLIFLNLKKRIFGSLGNRPGLLRKWVYNTPIIWSLPLHLEVLILQKFMESGDFTFSIFFS
jgi:hypothetical protein